MIRLGGTGFQPVVSGILPETWGDHFAHAFPHSRQVHARPKSGRMPDLTGKVPVPLLYLTCATLTASAVNAVIFSHDFSATSFRSAIHEPPIAATCGTAR